jgi:hypothetical protein
MQIGARSAQASTPANVPIERSKALLTKTVEVLSAGIARLLNGREEGFEQRATGGPSFEH